MALRSCFKLSFQLVSIIIVVEMFANVLDVIDAATIFLLSFVQVFTQQQVIMMTRKMTDELLECIKV